MLPTLMHRQYKGEIYIRRKAGIIHGTTTEIPLALLKKMKNLLLIKSRPFKMLLLPFHWLPLEKVPITVLLMYAVCAYMSELIF